MPTSFAIGQNYTRDEIADAILMPPERRGGAWDTGYDEWEGEVFIFANVGVAGRTGHDYHNRWEGKDFVWYGKTLAQRGQPQIDRIISNSYPVHVFWRGAARAPFTYAGIGTAIEVSDGAPVQVLWSFEDSSGPATSVSSTARPKPVSWRRGPPPSAGIAVVATTDGPTSVYLLRLEGDQAGLLDTPEGHIVIKVGMSNEVNRRVRELNAGFPPGSRTKWAVIDSRILSTAQDAYHLEGQRLEWLRQRGYWIGGEYAVLPETIVGSLLGEEDPA